MLNAARSLRQAAQTEPLPLLPALWRLNETFQVRRGELVMIAGIPNSGKSAFVLWWVASLRLPGLYFSADNGPHTTLVRLLSLVTQTDSKDITADLDDEVTGKQVEAEYLKELDDLPLQFCFEGAIDLNDISDELSAYVELYDEWPEVIVVDNLINVQGTEDHQGQNGILSELHYCARRTGAAVFVLHHMSESAPDGKKAPDPTMPPPRRMVQNKVTQYPDAVLSVAGDSIRGHFRVAVVKNRSDKADPGAVAPYLLYVDFPRCTFHSSDPNWSPTGGLT